MEGKKRKGGAEKERDKKRTTLEATASSSFKITNFFQSPTQRIDRGDDQNEVKVKDFAVETTPSVEPKDVIVEHEPAAAVNYFIKPTANFRPLFFSYHPVQPQKLAISKVNIFSRQNGTNRSWLTYCEDAKSLYCSVCLAYSRSDNTFTATGMKDWRHIHQRIEEHEKSKCHNESAEAHFLSMNKSDIGSLLFTRQKNLQKEKIRTNRQVLERIIDVVKVIGKRGLSYRGTSSESESAYSLDNSMIDHGNFLELILLLSKYDILLKDHLDKVIKKSKVAHASGSKGRGGSITLISKTMINHVIAAISSLMKHVIAEEIREAGMFSVQLDTTQDISIKDQCAVILRYLAHDQVQERLLAIVKTTDSTGQGFCELLKKTLKENDLDISNCVGNATDGASNMQGAYNGFTAWLNKEAPGQIHVWCYAHILNLVITDATKNIIAASSLFSLMNLIAVFFRESYKRMDVWENVRNDPRHKRLQMIGETRWWAKHAASSNIFGSFNGSKGPLYVDVLFALDTLEQSEEIKPDIRTKARSYKQSLLKYETLMTAFTYLRIFELTTPLSKYLQTSGLDLLKAHQFVISTLQKIEVIQRDICGVKAAVSKFIEWASVKIDEHCDTEGIETDIVIEDCIPEKRLRRKNRMDGETGRDEPIEDAFMYFTVNVHNRITDQVIESLKNRFEKNGNLYRDMACLQPVNFSEISTGIPEDALENLSSQLLKFNAQATKQNLQMELVNLAKNWNRLKQGLTEEYENSKTCLDVEENANLDNEQEQSISLVCKRCKDCAVCVYYTLEKYNLLTDAYGLIGLAYKYMLTLSCTQVACERSFSVLKFVKNRLRSSMSAEHLDSFMLMCVEKDILQKLDSDIIIDKVAEKSGLLSKKLCI